MEHTQNTPPSEEDFRELCSHGGEIVAWQYDDDEGDEWHYGKIGRGLAKNEDYGKGVMVEEAIEDDGIDGCTSINSGGTALPSHIKRFRLTTREEIEGLGLHISYEDID